MEFLANLGKDDVELTKRRGKNLVVIDPDAATRLAHHNRCDRADGQPPDATVTGGS